MKTAHKDQMAATTFYFPLYQDSNGKDFSHFITSTRQL